MNRSGLATDRPGVVCRLIVTQLCRTSQFGSTLVVPSVTMEFGGYHCLYQHLSDLYSLVTVGLYWGW